MISCDSFRTRFHAGTEDAALLEHLRSCDRCLDVAAHADPDVLFRSLGGAELVPPGGIDSFVSGVMQQVRVRDVESTVNVAGTVSWPRRLAMAAAIGVAVFGATLVSRTDAPQGTTQVASRHAVPRPAAAQTLSTRPIVEAYESDTATIVEMPSEGSDEVKIVMVFDENLPADL
jgi:hypothetical protein